MFLAVIRHKCGWKKTAWKSKSILPAYRPAILWLSTREKSSRWTVIFRRVWLPSTNISSPVKVSQWKKHLGIKCLPLHYCCLDAFASKLKQREKKPLLPKSVRYSITLKTIKISWLLVDEKLRIDFCPSNWVSVPSLCHWWERCQLWPYCGQNWAVTWSTLAHSRCWATYKFSPVTAFWSKMAGY